MMKLSCSILGKVYYVMEDYSKLSLRKIGIFHGVPLSSISDRGTQFISQFWESFQKCLGTKVKLS